LYSITDRYKIRDPLDTRCGLRMWEGWSRLRSKKCREQERRVEAEELGVG